MMCGLWRTTVLAQEHFLWGSKHKHEASMFFMKAASFIVLYRAAWLLSAWLVVCLCGTRRCRQLYCVLCSTGCLCFAGRCIARYK